MRQKEGVQMRTFPPDVIKAKADTSEAMLREIAQQKRLQNRKVYDSFVGYRQAAHRCANVSDLAQHPARGQLPG
jgi:TRAP-type mannitol/chloroaromatic compound transport system substrate-binding protein